MIRTAGPVLEPDQDPTEEGRLACPGLGGGHNWEPTTYSPQTGLYYFGSTDGCEIYKKMPQEFVEGQMYQSGDVEQPPKDLNKGSLIAVEPSTGDIKWRYEMVRRPSGLLSTAGGLLFVADPEGYLIAFDAKSGKILWHFQTGGGLRAPPVSYSFQGRQFIALTSGPNLIVFRLP